MIRSRCTRFVEKSYENESLIVRIGLTKEEFGCSNVDVRIESTPATSGGKSGGGPIQNFLIISSAAASRQSDNDTIKHPKATPTKIDKKSSDKSSDKSSVSEDDSSSNIDKDTGSSSHDQRRKSRSKRNTGKRATSTNSKDRNRSNANSAQFYYATKLPDKFNRTEWKTEWTTYDPKRQASKQTPAFLPNPQISAASCRSNTSSSNTSVSFTSTPATTATPLGAKSVNSNDRIEIRPSTLSHPFVVDQNKIAPNFTKPRSFCDNKTPFIFRSFQGIAPFCNNVRACPAATLNKMELTTSIPVFVVTVPLTAPPPAVPPGDQQTLTPGSNSSNTSASIKIRSGSKIDAAASVNGSKVETASVSGSKVEAASVSGSKTEAAASFSGSRDAASFGVGGGATDGAEESKEVSSSTTTTTVKWCYEEGPVFKYPKPPVEEIGPLVPSSHMDSTPPNATTSSKLSSVNSNDRIEIRKSTPGSFVDIVSNPPTSSSTATNSLGKELASSGKLSVKSSSNTAIALKSSNTAAYEASPDEGYESSDIAAPDDIGTEPRNLMTFNGPFTEKKFYLLLIRNTNLTRPILWRFATNDKKIFADPSKGYLENGASVKVEIACEAFCMEESQNGDASVFLQIPTATDATSETTSKKIFIDWVHFNYYDIFDRLEW